MAPSLRLLLATLALVLGGLTGATAIAAADVAAPPAVEAEVPPVGEEAEPAPMSVEFPRRRASLVGERALVFVRCSGIVSYTCEGTLVLSGAGGAHKVPYSIERGQRQALAVPLGEEDAVERGAKLRAVARTLQLSGATVRTSSFVRVG